jgi:hypothetical protein
MLDELRVTARRWGVNLMRPEEEAYEMMPEGLSSEVEKSPSTYMNNVTQ